MNTAANFSGVDRRRHRIYVTRNTEYHFRDGLCVAVKDRNSGEFLHGHLALRRRVQGSLQRFDNGALVPRLGEPRTGESLFFLTGGRDLVTSPIQSIERPAKAITQAYPLGTQQSNDGDLMLTGDAEDEDCDADFFS